jgi:hypothetical protein
LSPNAQTQSALPRTVTSRRLTAAYALTGGGYRRCSVVRPMWVAPAISQGLLRGAVTCHERVAVFPLVVPPASNGSSRWPSIGPGDQRRFTPRHAKRQLRNATPSASCATPRQAVLARVRRVARSASVQLSRALAGGVRPSGNNVSTNADRGAPRLEYSVARILNSASCRTGGRSPSYHRL